MLRGAEDHKGFDSEANRAVPIEVIVRVLELVKEEAQMLPSSSANELYKFGAYLVGLHESFYVDLAGLCKNLTRGREGVMPTNPMKKGTVLDNAPHVVLCLMGKFKGETGHRYHMIALASETMTGIQTRWWLEKLVVVKEIGGQISKPAFSDVNGRLIPSVEFNDLFKHYLKQIQEEPFGLLAADDEVEKFYGTNRTPRKTAEQRARNAGLGTDVQDAMSRWKIVESTGRKQSRFNMHDHYSDARLMMPVTWRYAYAQ